MFRLLYIVFGIALGSSSFVMSMDQSFFLIPHNNSLLNFRRIINPERNKELVELRKLNLQDKPEKRESLLKFPETTKEERMHELHYRIDLFFASSYPKYSDFIKCINTCNYAKRFGINEDHMGLFAFYHDNPDFNQRTSLFFYFLKYYNKSVGMTREIPFKMWSPLAKRLDVVSDTNNKCSAIEVLINDTNMLLLKRIPNYDELISFLHSKQKFDELDDKYVNFEADWKNQFVCDAFQVFCSEDFHNKLYDIVAVVNKAKEQGLIHTENELGDYVLSYEPTIFDRMAMGSWVVSYDDHKKKIGLLCSCIKKYNSLRKEKVTPSVQLYRIYKAIEPLHIIEPDIFDKDLLNPEKIAFAEYAELLADIVVLYHSYDEAIEDCINVLYPLRI